MLTYPPATRTVLVDALTDLIDGGSIEIRSGTRPASAADAATGTLLATITLESPSFAGGSAGVATVADPDPVDADADGTASWFRAFTSGAATAFDGSVTQTGGGGDITLATVELVEGLSIDITGGTITIGAGSAA
jgi:hypothetical protein